MDSLNDKLDKAVERKMLNKKIIILSFVAIILICIMSAIYVSLNGFSTEKSHLYFLEFRIETKFGFALILSAYTLFFSLIAYPFKNIKIKKLKKAIEEQEYKERELSLLYEHNKLLQEQNEILRKNSEKNVE